MQIIAILFLGVFALGMGAKVIQLLKRNLELEEKLFFSEENQSSMAHSLNVAEDELDAAYDERIRLIKLVSARTIERDDAHEMLKMVLNYDLENDVAPNAVGVEIGRNGLHYKFTYKDGGHALNEASISFGSNPQSEVASRDSSEQAPEEREAVP